MGNTGNDLRVTREFGSRHHPVPNQFWTFSGRTSADSSQEGEDLGGGFQRCRQHWECLNQTAGHRRLQLCNADDQRGPCSEPTLANWKEQRHLRCYQRRRAIPATDRDVPRYPKEQEQDGGKADSGLNPMANLQVRWAHWPSPDMRIRGVRRGTVESRGWLDRIEVLDQSLDMNFEFRQLLQTGAVYTASRECLLMHGAVFWGGRDASNFCSKKLFRSSTWLTMYGHVIFCNVDSKNISSCAKRYPLRTACLSVQGPYALAASPVDRFRFLDQMFWPPQRWFIVLNAHHVHILCPSVYNHGAQNLLSTNSAVLRDRSDPPRLPLIDKRGFNVPFVLSSTLCHRFLAVASKSEPPQPTTRVPVPVTMPDLSLPVCFMLTCPLLCASLAHFFLGVQSLRVEHGRLSGICWSQPFWWGATTMENKTFNRF